jgi:hypothetical protein
MSLGIIRSAESCRSQVKLMKQSKTPSIVSEYVNVCPLPVLSKDRADE